MGTHDAPHPTPELASLPKTARLRDALLATLEELNRTDLDPAALARTIRLHADTLVEVASAVSDPLIEELVSLRIQPLPADASPAEVRIAQAQLAGWVNGLLAAIMPLPPVEAWDPDPGPEGTSGPGPGG
jgi:hypothetical protein